MYEGREQRESLLPPKPLLRLSRRVGGRRGAGAIWRRGRRGGGRFYSRLLGHMVRFAGVMAARNMLRLGCTCRGGALPRAGGVGCCAGGRRRLSVRDTYESDSGKNGKSDRFHLCESGW